jgi:hypothetical protein
MQTEEEEAAEEDSEGIVKREAIKRTRARS